MARFENVEIVSLLSVARLFLLKALKEDMFSDFKITMADKETETLITQTFLLAGGHHATKCKETGLSETDNYLQSIFNVFSGVEEKDRNSFFDFQEMDGDRIKLPIPEGKTDTTSASLQRIAEKLLKKLREKNFTGFSPNQLLRLLEVTLSYVSDGVIDNTESDISLYDRAKLAAAFAACISKYMIHHNLSGVEGESYSEQPAFLMVSGDISGIQQFIYTIPSKGALKSLRGRSFYLEILLENIADEILSACEISRTCLLYTGGGHFYLLAPNTEETVAVLNSYKRKINAWFLKNFGTLLYIAMGWIHCSIHDLTSDQTGEVYRQVGRQVASDKLCRYDEESLAALFSPESELNKNRNGERECSICHMSNVDLEAYNLEDGTEACPVCRDLFLLGQNVISDDTAFIVTNNNSENALPIPGVYKDYYLRVSSFSASGVQKTQSMAVRTYVKNITYLDCEDVIYLWISDYTYRDEYGKVLEFNELASLAGGEKEETGIERLAVLRADVDNLGAAFISGFPEKYSSLARSTVLSRYLSLFFKRYVNLICQGNLNGIPEESKRKFSLFKNAKGEKRRVHVVYSGGDDLFIVGVWDDLIELAVDIRMFFSVFTNDKLSFSAGIGFFQDKCPVSQMARKTGELEDVAKGNDGKNSVALFGFDSEEKKNKQLGVQRYKWAEFADKVCGEKLAFLLRYVTVNDKDDPAKLKIGKTALYRLLTLLESTATNAGNIDIARFAYTLARMEPDKRNYKSQEAYKKIRMSFYEWYKSWEDRRQLSTALQLLIYRLREKGDLKDGQ